jgi:multiple sugar transport system ATP-binding protein
MNDGRIDQWARRMVLSSAQDSICCGFIGSPAMNFLPARIEQNGRLIVRLSEALTFPIPATHTQRYRVSGQGLVFGQVSSTSPNCAGKPVILAANSP